MTAKKFHLIATVLLIIVLAANLLNVQVAFADGETPTEPPATQVETELPPPTELPAEPLLESTPVPVEGDVPNENDLLGEAPSPETVSAENTPVTGILADVPEETSVVVLDEAGQPLTLGSQETADAVIDSDPVWCPASVTTPTPGANGCSNSYATITDLLTAMRTNRAAFDENGTIFLEKPNGQGFTTPLILNDSATSLSDAFSTLSAFDLTIQGGWNKDTPGTFSGQTNFGAGGGSQGYILIGSATNPWVGNVALYDLHISYASAANGVTVYTTTGNITLDNVDVDEQSGIKYTGYLDTNSGTIVVEDSYFNGSNQGQNRNRGFYAETNTGSISITGSGNYTFQDALGTDPANYNGATLSAPTVTLTNVISQDNDGNGIEIRNASTVTLSNVMAGPNIDKQGNRLSGILVNGTGSTVVNVFGGVFADNGSYGIEVLNGTLYFNATPTCPTVGITINGADCFNVTPVSATPTQPTPTQPTPTEPTPTQPTPTQPTPTQPTPTEATPTPPTIVPTQATPTPPTSASSTPGAPVPTSAGSGSASQNVIIPQTGDGLINLSCNSVFWAFGIKVSFMNLCDQQTELHAVGADELPAELPDGFSFVMGLDVDILSDGQVVETLPEGTGIQMDFPTGSDDEFTVLNWDEDNAKWTEASLELDHDKVSQAVSSGDELYHLVNEQVSGQFCQALTTAKTGIFVLVKK